MYSTRLRSSSSSSTNIAKKSITSDLNMAGGGDSSETQCSNNDLMEVLRSNQRQIATLTEDVATIKLDIKDIKEKHAVLDTKVSGIDDRVIRLEGEVERLSTLATTSTLTVQAFCRSQISAVKSQYKSMAFNVIAYNAEENLDEGETWEKSTVSIERSYEILETVFGITNARTDIHIVTAHRLPSSKPGRKPRIFKLACMSDKEVLWANIKHVKTYNDSVGANSKVHIQMIQLPSKLAHDKASLQADFDTAHQNNMGPKWRYLKNSGVYCFVIGSTFHKPKVDYFIHKYTFEKKDD